MAKVRAPLFSMEARNQIGKQLVYFPWKGIDAVRSYVIPANPKTAGQVSQRNKMSLAVEQIQALRVHADYPFVDADYSAYRGLAAVYATPMTWFNAITKSVIESLLAASRPLIGSDMEYVNSTPGRLYPHIALWGSECLAAELCYGTSPTALLTRADADRMGFETDWEASTAYSLGDYCVPATASKNGFVYKCTTAGTSGATEPTWPTTYGATVTDGTVVWTCVFEGHNLFELDVTGLPSGKVYYFQFQPKAGDACEGARTGIYSYLIP